jgi:hypothetical protein
LVRGALGIERVYEGYEVARRVATGVLSGDVRSLVEVLVGRRIDHTG